MTLPLEGIRVIDFSAYFAMPSAMAYLGDFGAEVIKVEPRHGADERRVFATPWLQNEGWNHHVFSRGKKSIVVDVSKPKGKQIIYDLVERSDVVIENYRLGVVENLGIDYKTLNKINPRIIYVAQSAWGQTGPYKDKMGYDIFVQGFTGLALPLKKVEPPLYAPAVMGGFTQADHQICMYCCFGILMALMVREKTGRGQFIDGALLGGGMSLEAERMCRVKADPNPLVYEGPLDPLTFPTLLTPFPPINPMYMAYNTRGGEAGISIAVLNDEDWQKFCYVMELDNLAANPAYDSHEKRVAAGQELCNAIQGRFEEQSWEECLWRLQEAGVPCAVAYNRMRDVFKANDFYFEDPQSKAMGFTERVEHPDIGPIDVLSCNAKLEKTPAKAQGPAPYIGEHTDEILDWLGYTQEDIEELKKEDVVTWTGFLPFAGRRGVGIQNR